MPAISEGAMFVACFLPIRLFRYDEGVRKDLVSQDDVQPLPPQADHAFTEGSGVYSSNWRRRGVLIRLGKKGEGHVTAWACRDVLDAPGAASYLIRSSEEEVDRR